MSTENVCDEEKLPLLVKKLDASGENLGDRAQRLNYPKAVFFVLISKFFEAFAANGVRTILALYLRDSLNFAESISTIFLHIFNFFSQFCPIFGAILADNYVGNSRTVSYFYIIYTIGWLGIILTSFPFMYGPVVSLVSMSLLFISIGNGSIRACITTLGALQFQLPEQEVLLNNYFSLYYFFYYIGIFLSKILPPFVRSKVSCYGQTDCYPAVFGVLGVSFFISLIIFLIGKKFYKNETITEGNTLLNVCAYSRDVVTSRINNCTFTIKSDIKLSEKDYTDEFKGDVRKIFQILLLFLPLPIYWALLAQQDSTWTFQASQMDTNIFGFMIEPDQAKAVGPIILFLLIPFWQYVVTPLLNYWEMKFHPLHSVAVGGICSALAFVCAGVLQIYIDISDLTKINILWQIPQFLLLMMGELFLSIPGLQFAYTQAPVSMKSFLTAIWYLNNAIGNLIVVLLTEINITDDQSSQYFIYAIIMFLCISIFTKVACDFKEE